MMAEVSNQLPMKSSDPGPTEAFTHLCMLFWQQLRPLAVDALVTSSRPKSLRSLDGTTSDRARHWRMAALRGAPRRTPPGKPSDSV